MRRSLIGFYSVKNSDERNEMKFPRSVGAARAIGMDKKNLAEALFMEVPPRRGRPPLGQATIEEQLEDVAAEILAETGESYDWRTLQTYRNVAAWATKNEPGHGLITAWADASWTAHREAYDSGMT